MKHLTVVACLGALVSFTLAGTARAIEPITKFADYGPTLAGKGALFGFAAQINEPVSPSRAMYAEPGSPPITLAEFGTGNYLESIALAGTPERFLAGYVGFDSCCGGGGDFPDEEFVGDVQFVTGAIGGPADALAGCFFDSEVNWYVHSAMSANRVAWVGDATKTCGSNARVYVKSVDALAADGPIASIDLAGNRLAILRPTSRADRWSVAIWNTDLGVRTNTVHFTDRSTPTVEVQDDGKLLIARYKLRERSTETCEIPSEVLIYQPSATVPSRYPLATCTTFAKLAGDRVAVFESQGSGRYRLVITNLDGTSPTTVHHSFSPEAGSLGKHETFDFDGARVAWTEVGCVDEPTYVANLSDVERRPARACPVRSRGSKRLRVARNGTFRFKFECPHGCSGLFALSGRGIQEQRRVGESPYLDDTFMFADRGGSGSNRVGLFDEELRSLRRRGPTMVNITFVSQAAPVSRGRTTRTFRRLLLPPR